MSYPRPHQLKKTRPEIRYQCEQCGEEVHPNSKSVAQRVVGWIVPRSAGGANHIRHQERMPAFAHVACLAELHDEAQGTQEGLF